MFPFNSLKELKERQVDILSGSEYDDETRRAVAMMIRQPDKTLTMYVT